MTTPGEGGRHERTFGMTTAIIGDKRTYRQLGDIIVTPDTLAVIDADYDFECDQLFRMNGQRGVYSDADIARQQQRVDEAKRMQALEWAIWNGTVTA